ncbi:MAG: hypothetical protein K0Q79_3601 [Flavipsychrobacter sp.]|nr:hypothetical protein [Flavipsychrobacter sp.]
MKKILVALVMIGTAYSTANAQSSKAKACGVKQEQVCRVSKDKKAVSCYKTQYAENFKVCKGDHGYTICCETPGVYNSTHYNFVANKAISQNNNQDQNMYQYTATASDNMAVDMTVPQNQSYVNTTYNIYSNSYTYRGGKKACYMGNNVAASNRAPYEGCPSPQSEGPDVNKQRNLNASNPTNMPPLAGQPK